MVEIQLTPAQEARKEAMYDSGRNRWKAYEAGGEMLAAHDAAYARLVAEQKADMGEDAPCWHTDPSLWGSFSDWYKDENGFRPSWPMSAAEAQDWLERHGCI